MSVFHGVFGFGEAVGGGGGSTGAGSIITFGARTMSTAGSTYYLYPGNSSRGAHSTQVPMALPIGGTLSKMYAGMTINRSIVPLDFTLYALIEAVWTPTALDVTVPAENEGPIGNTSDSVVLPAGTFIAMSVDSNGLDIDRSPLDMLVSMHLG